MLDRLVMNQLFDYLKGVCDVARISADFGGVISWACQVFNHSGRESASKAIRDIFEDFVWLLYLWLQ